jgi:hypothetical protein
MASLRGYILLVPYWSNEFGGTLVVVDGFVRHAKGSN